MNDFIGRESYRRSEVKSTHSKCKACSLKIVAGRLFRALALKILPKREPILLWIALLGLEPWESAGYEVASQLSERVDEKEGI